MQGDCSADYEEVGPARQVEISPNRLIYRVYHESELIGGIPVSQVRLRHSREAIKFLYPICDSWLEVQVDEPIADGATEETHEEYLTRKTEEVRESFRALQRLEDRARETAIDMMRQPEKYTLSGLQALIAPREVTAAEEEVDAIPGEPLPLKENIEGWTLAEPIAGEKADPPPKKARKKKAVGPGSGKVRSSATSNP